MLASTWGSEIVHRHGYISSKIGEAAKPVQYQYAILIKNLDAMEMKASAGS